MLGREVGVIQQAREEVGSTAGHREVLVEQQPEDAARVPHVEQVDRDATDERAEERVQHPDEVANGGTGEGGDGVRRGQDGGLTSLEADRAVGMDDTLRVAGRPRRERHDGGVVGIDGDRLPEGIVLERRTERQCVVGNDPLGIHDPPGDAELGDDVGQVRGVVAATEAVRRHEHGRVGGTEDVVELLRAVEVHDRHDHGAGEGGAPERDGRLPPVGQLHHDDVARDDPLPDQPRGERSGRPADVADRAPPGADLGVDHEGELVRALQPLVHERAEAPVVPPALLEVVRDDLLRDLPLAPSCGQSRPLSSTQASG